MRAESATMARKSSGTIASDDQRQERVHPHHHDDHARPRSTTDVRIGKKPFIVSVWMANVSAVSR